MQVTVPSLLPVDVADEASQLQAALSAMWIS
jgi:hypothetical protein